MVRLLGALGLLGLALVMTAPASAQKAKANPPKNNKANDAAIDKKFDQWEENQRSLLMAHHKGKFAQADTNRDGFLSEEELAIAFRGKFAKPPMIPGTPAGTEADKLPPPPNATTPAFNDGKKYPDQEFLLAVDDDSDRRVSLAEYLDWADDFVAVQAQALRQVEEAKYEVLQLQLQIAKSQAGAQRQALENRLRQQQLQISQRQQDIRDRDNNPQKHKKKKKNNNKKR